MPRTRLVTGASNTAIYIVNAQGSRSGQLGAESEQNEVVKLHCCLCSASVQFLVCGDTVFKQCQKKIVNPNESERK